MTADITAALANLQSLVEALANRMGENEQRTTRLEACVERGLPMRIERCAERMDGHGELIAKLVSRPADLAAQLAEARNAAYADGLASGIERGTAIGKYLTAIDACCAGEPHTCDQEAVAAAEGKTDRLIIELAEARAECEQLKARLNPTLEQHDANPARYWADRELERDSDGNRTPRLADCDLPKYHLRLALAEIERQRQWIAGLDAGLCDDSIAKQTAQAIAAWLEQHPEGGAFGAELAADIRADRWRPTADEAKEDV